jgi:gamma-glutamyltranspeptidase/glutathione hydrolase
MADPGLARLVVDAHGRPLAEGDKVVQPELADFLSKVRTNPFGETEAMIAELAHEARKAGASLTDDDLKRNGAEWRNARVVPWKGLSIGMPDTAGARQVLQLWKDLDDGDDYIDADGADRPAILAAAMRKVYGNAGGVGAGPPEEGSTGIAAVDKDGSAVACTVTMGRPFGARVSAAKSGVVLAAAPPPGRDYGTGIVPMIGVNRPFLALTNTVDTLYFVTAGTAETAAGPNQLAVAISLFDDDITLDQALALPRIRDGGAAVEYENGMPGPSIAAMRDHALSVRAADLIGHIHAVYCPGGYDKDEAASCRFRADKRSYGLVARGE